ncbi:metallophosphoesterase family protein [Mucilaginibacter sp. KACC 22063]|uniref:metallophosphoesterase family protein n=1 Tax=Mucilaginibacter sp. KACC 22063 TaxID=3025666 RepID=UPI0023658F48|nr:metallophosphoesterase [Mucilaginibacter sp. KACC 22063]WDF54496.1 metallophosphoesterase [Mucilaginibacter sp. KACC 22063]
MEEKKITRIAAVGDIHVKETDKGKWADYFREVSSKADVLIICGDLTDTGDEDEAHILAAELQACTIPVICVLGNHDYEKGRQKMIRQALQGHNVYVLDGEAITVGNVGFAGIKGFGGGFDNHMLTMFGEDAMKAFVQETVNEALKLERALAKLEADPDVIHKIAVLHYAPVSATVIGEPEAIFPFLGSSRLAEPMLRKGVSVCFHGHAHAGTLEGSINGSGIKVYNVAKPILVKAGYQCPYYLYEV